MQFSAYVMFEASSEQEAATEVGGWGLSPGTTVTLTPIPNPTMATVDDSGDLVAYDPSIPPPEAPPESGTLPADTPPETGP